MKNNKFLSFILSVIMTASALPVIPAGAELTEPDYSDRSNSGIQLAAEDAYTVNDNVYTWDLTKITGSINYDETAYRSGTNYEFYGLTISANGDNNATISDSGVFMKNKNNAYIAYTPSSSGILEVTAYAPANTEICVSEKVGTKTNTIINKPTEAGTYTETIDLTAGKTYYIFDGSSQSSYIEKLVYKVTPAYTEIDNVYTWDLKRLTDFIDYDEAAYRSGTNYEFHGLTISANGDNYATISDSGVYMHDKTKAYIMYTPSSDGILAVTAKTPAATELRVNETFGEKVNIIINPETGGTYTAETNLTAGKTYYIYDTSSKLSYVEKLVYTVSVQPTPTTSTEAEPSPTATTEAEPSPTATTEVQPSPTATTEVQPSPTATTEVQPSPTATTEAQPSPTATTEAQPSPTATTEVQPSPTATAEVQPSPTATAEVKPTPTATTEIQPSPTATTTVAPSPTATTAVEPSPTATTTVAPSPTATTTAAPSPTATTAVEPSPTATTPAEPKAAHTKIGNVEAWNIDAFSSVISDFDGTAFTAGEAYTYEGLTLTGGAGAVLDSNGLLIKKLTSGSNGHSIAYMPTEDGTLTVTADTRAVKAEVYVNTKVDKSKATQIIYSETEKGIRTGTAELKAGTTYYIFSGASVDVTLKQLIYTTSAVQPSPTATTDVQPSPTSTAEVKPSPTTTAAAQPTPTATTEVKPSPTATANVQPSPTATTAVEPSPTATTPAEPKAAHTKIGNVETWNIDAFSGVISGFDGTEFTSGKAYTYEGLTLTGGADAVLDSNGLLIKKLTSGSNGHSIAYMPTEDGTLTVTVDTRAVKAEVYVNTKVDKSKATQIIYSETEKGIRTGTAELKAGTTYYIFSGASVDVTVKQLVYTTSAAQPSPTATTEIKPSPTATEEVKPSPTATAATQPTPTATTPVQPSPTTPSEPVRAYIKDGGTETWNLNAFKEALTGFDAEEFAAGGLYIYEGLTLIGGEKSVLNDRGLLLQKIASNNEAYTVKYTPTEDGTLTVTADTAAVKAEIYVNTIVDKKGGTQIIYSETEKGILKGTIKLTAGNTYYIFSGASVDAYIRQLVYTTGSAQPSPDTTPTAAPGTQPTPPSGDTENAYIPEGDTQTWNIGAFRDVLTGFDAADFSGGKAYTYEGVTLTGGDGAVLNNNGMLIKKITSGSEAYTVAYRPLRSGTLTVTADTAAIKAEIYVNTRVDKSGATQIIYSETEKGTLTGTAELTAGNTYYIFSGASVDATIKQLVYTFNNDPSETDAPDATEAPDVPFTPTKPRESFDAADEDKLSVTDFGEDSTYEYSTNTRYPVDITSARSGVRTIASGVKLEKNGQHVAFDMTLNTLLKENTTASGAPDTFSLELTSATSRVGGMLVAKKQDTVDGKDAVLLDWRTGSWSNKLTKPIIVGEKYTFDFSVNTITDGETETLDTLNLYIYDKDGNLYDYATGLSRRNAASIQMIYLMAQPRAIDQTDSVTIENIRTFYYKPDSTLLRIITDSGKEELSTDSAYAIETDKFNDTEWKFDTPYSMLAEGSAASYMATDIDIQNADGTALSEGIAYDSARRTLKTDSGLNAGDYELKAVVTSSYDGQTVLTEEYPITLTRPEVSPEDVMEEYTPTVLYNGISVTPGMTVTGNIALPSSNAVVGLSWRSSNRAAVSNSGVVTRQLDDTEVTLEAVVSSAEDPTKTKTETITITVLGVRPMLDDAIAKAKAGIVSVDDGREMNADSLLDLHEDIKLVTKYKNREFTGYDKVAYEWKSDSDYLKALEETAEIWPDKVQKYNANLTLTTKYEDQSLEENIPVTINLTKDNAAGKYAVRCDSIAEENFTGVERYAGTTVSGDISLPQDGIFGSTISWTSSAQMYMSNTGKYNAPSNNTSVTLSAVLSKDNVMSDSSRTFSMTLQGKSNTVFSGGGGGGGGSSSGRTTKITSSGSAVPRSSNTAGTPASQNTPAQPQDTSGTAFTDLDTVPWAKEAINALAADGVISGREDGIFAPNDEVTRAEFAKIIVGAFDLLDSEAEAEEFTDADKNAWYYPYVASAYKAGIIGGYGDGLFGVNDKITRQDMAVIIYRAAAIAGIELEAVNEEIIFEDEASVSDYAKEAVAALQTAGVINGISDTEFAPLLTATRAQAAKMIYETR